MAFHLTGICTPHRKNTANMSAVKMEPPKTVTLPMQMHIGAPAKPCVKAGDKVFVGTLIAQSGGAVSSPVYSSVSGTVSKIQDILVLSGNTVSAVVIESDFAMENDPNITPPVIEKREDFIQAVKESGIVGLGGAGFPTYIKLNVNREVEEIIINGAECEPYITSDSVNMVDRAEDIAEGIVNLKKYLEPKKIIIAIEKNKPAAIKAMQNIAKDIDGVEVRILPSRYPQGGEKVIVYATTGKQIGLGKLPIDVGSIVINVTTVATIGAYIKTGMPLTQKCITVDGNAVNKPMNVIAPIGTSLQDVFDFCGGFNEEPQKILYGGPMMGVSVPSLDAPVLKNTNALLAFKGKMAFKPDATACISCGACANNCPFGINPPLAQKAIRNNDMEALNKTGIALCMECGCCSYVCPAKRPLVQNNKLAKDILKEYLNNKKEEKK